MSSAEQDRKLRKTILRKTVLSFSLFILCIILAVGIWKWIRNQPREGRMYRPLRKGVETSSGIFRNFFSHKNLTPTFPVSKALKKPRVNGNLGLKTQLDTTAWKLLVLASAGTDTLFISLDELKRLPKTEIVYDFKCIEGWSQITHWGGVKFSEFLAHYNLGTRGNLTKKSTEDFENFFNYAGLETPDKEYYVGIDMPSILHPQTLLCYEMNGLPLTEKHGAPLRLIIPVKYGIKSLKRIGLIYFSDDRPKDYWAERGYDYDSGL